MGELWVDACSAPCGRRFGADGFYAVGPRLSGSAFLSKPVDLGPYQGRDVTLEVTGGGRGRRVAGAILLPVGLIIAAISPLAFLSDKSGARALGGIGTAAGAGIAVGGVVMLIRSRIRVTTVPGKPRRTR